MFSRWSLRAHTLKIQPSKVRIVARRRTVIPKLETLEARQLLSGVTLDALSQATPLRSMHVRTAAAANGSVGGLVSDNLYTFDVTAPINLNITLSNLRQSDSVTLLFADGSGLSTASTGGARIGRFYQRLDPGTYYLDVGTGFAASAGAATTKALPPRRIVVPTTAYHLLIQGVRPDQSAAPLQPASGPGGLPVPTGGFGVEPQISGVNNFAGWKDFSANPIFGTGGPSPDDIVQGGVGDCYFLSTLSNVARNDPGLIQQDVTQLANGTYQVKFERNGQDVFENVDASFAVDANGAPIFANLGTGGSIWVAVMEKAFCFFRHPDQPASYSQIDFGSGAEVFADLGGNNIGSLSAYQFRTGNQLVNEISNELAAGKVIDYATTQQPPDLVASHIYAVVQVNGDGTVMLRNPWGINPNTPGDGGYLNLTPNQLLYNLNGFTSADFTSVQPVPNPQPIIPPEPTPPPSSQLVVVGNGYLGQNSYDLHNGRWGDAAVVTAAGDGTADVVMESSDFAATVEVLQINADGTTTLVAYDSNPNRSVDAVAEFQALAGTRYEVVLSSVDPSVGNYALGITTNLGNYQPFGPTG